MPHRTTFIAGDENMSDFKRIYADNAATTQCSVAAIRAMTPYFYESYGNPSSLHSYGQEAANALAQAREIIAQAIGGQPQEVFFTASGTESDNQAIISAARFGARKNKRHIISSAIEHHAVLHTLDALEKEGWEITLLPVDEYGLITPEQVKNAIREDTALVSVMLANNEIGTIQPIGEIAAICRESGVICHTDAVQAMGHIPVNAADLGIDMLSLSGHKIHGPKGAGVLWCRRGIPLTSIIHGGAQERGKRAGTENIPAIVGTAVALEEAVTHCDSNASFVRELRDLLIDGLSEIPASRLNGHPTKRLPGNTSFCFEGVEGESMLLLLDQNGICASSGSACTSGSLEPSHVLLALGLPHEIAHGSLRLSLSADNTREEIDHIIKVLPPIIQRLRDMSPLWRK